MGLWLQGGFFGPRAYRRCNTLEVLVILFFRRIIFGQLLRLKHGLCMDKTGKKFGKKIFLEISKITYFSCIFSQFYKNVQILAKKWVILNISENIFFPIFPPVPSKQNPCFKYRSWQKMISLKNKISRSSNVLHLLYVRGPKIPPCSHRPICKNVFFGSIKILEQKSNVAQL